jgi:hypothetical protein
VVEATSSGATVSRGTATNATRLGNGVYTVTFGQSVTACAYVASVGSTSDGTAPPYYATVEQQTSVANTIIVRTFDDGGTLQPPGTGFGFHVAVIC